MKRRLTTFLRLTLLVAVMAVGSVFSLGAQEHGEYVVVIPQSGEQYTVKMDDVDRITLGDREVTVSTNSGQTKSYGYGDVDRILIGAKTDGIRTITAGGNIAVWPTLVTSTLHIAGAEAGIPVKVFDVSGKLVSESKTTTDTLELNLENAPAGICIVCIGNHTVRIVKK